MQKSDSEKDDTEVESEEETTTLVSEEKEQTKKTKEDLDLRRRMRIPLRLFDMDDYTIMIHELKEGWLKDERMHHLWEVSMITRHGFRSLFGELLSLQCGHFLERMMTRIIHEYSYNVEYYDSNDDSSDHVLIGHMDLLRAAVVSEDGRYLYTAARDNCIIIWDLTSDALIKQWVAHDDNVVALAYHSGLLFSGSKDTKIKIWDSFNQHLIHILEGHNDAVQSIDVSIQGEFFLSASWDRTARLWSVENGDCLRIFKGHTDYLAAAHLIGDGSTIVTGSDDELIKVWDLQTAKELKTVSEGIESAIGGICLNCDESLLACVSFDSSISVYSFPDCELIRIIKQRSLRGRFHPLLPNILSVDDNLDYSLKMLDVESGKCIHSFKGHTEYISDCCFTPDGRRVISVSDDLTARVWDVSFLFEMETKSDTISTTET